MTQPTVTVSLGQLDGWVLGTSLLGTDTTLAEYVYTDITDRTLGFSYRRGRQHELDRIEAGTATFTFMNQDGALTPSNTASSLWPDVRPMAPIKIEATYPPAAFSPSDIAGLVAWYDFSDISTLWQDTARTSAISADGQTIKGVTDLSGAAAHLSEATNGPTYKVAIIGSRSIARFDGVNDILKATMSADTSQTIIIVAQKRSAPGSASRTLFGMGTGDITQLFTDSDYHATAYCWYADQALAVVTLTGTATNVTAAIIRVNSAASLDFYANGGSVTNLNPFDDVTTLTTFGYGANAGTTLNPTDSDVCEALVYNSALAAGDLNDLGTYLAGRWGFTWTTI